MANGVTWFTVPTSGSQPQGIATGPDGNLWFVESAGNKIGKRP
jgi:virginiamycin B lyase